jgi:twitching motility protein PilT
MEIKALLEASVKKNASDLHISPDMPPLLRVHGDLVPMENEAALNADAIKTMVYGLMESEQKKRI